MMKEILSLFVLMFVFILAPWPALSDCFIGESSCWFPGCCEKQLRGPCEIAILKCKDVEGSVKIYIEGKLVYPDPKHKEPQRGKEKESE